LRPKLPIARFVRLGALAAGCIAPSCCLAVSLFAGLTYLDHDYTEYSATGDVLVNERGRMLAPSLGVEHGFGNGLTLGLRYWSANRTIDYEGTTQSGRPLATSADQDFGETSVFASYRFTHDEWFFDARGGYGAWAWQRRLAATEISLPLAIDYDWYQWSIGFELGHSLRWGEVSMRLERLGNEDVEARLDLASYGIGKILLEPGADSGVRLTLTHRYRWSRHWTAAQYVYYEQQGFGKSDTVGVMTGTRILLFTEPRSETERLALAFRFEYSFR
jgi:hypothetical protein